MDCQANFFFFFFINGNYQANFGIMQERERIGIYMNDKSRAREQEGENKRGVY